MDEIDPGNSEDKAVWLVVTTTDHILDACEDMVSQGMPETLLLACLIRVTRVYQDKCGVPLDRVVTALRTAAEGDNTTCTTT